MLLKYIQHVPAAIFITVLSDVYAFSFGLILVPVATGLPVSSGLSIYLLSVVCGQLAMSLLSGFKHASSGAAYELAPLLVDIALTVTPFCESSAAMASTLLVANALTSALVGTLYIAVSWLRLGAVFRCFTLPSPSPSPSPSPPPSPSPSPSGASPTSCSRLR